MGSRGSHAAGRSCAWHAPRSSSTVHRATSVPCSHSRAPKWAERGKEWAMWNKRESGTEGAQSRDSPMHYDTVLLAIRTAASLKILKLL
jgi:hypothetical protein